MNCPEKLAEGFNKWLYIDSCQLSLIVPIQADKNYNIVLSIISTGDVSLFKNAYKNSTTLFPYGIFKIKSLENIAYWYLQRHILTCVP